MMRGMFAAISGLKQHQVMLDVTANDISNVNTLGYKSSRVTFQDSLTQMQRGAAGPRRQQRRLERRPGRPRRRPRLGRQPDDRRRRADHRQPARRRDPGRRLLPDRRGRARQRRPRPDHADRLHARGQLLDQRPGLPDHADRPVRASANQPPGAATDRDRDPDPGRRHRRRHRPDRRRVLHRPGHADPRDAVPPDAGHVLERRRPRAHGRQPLDRPRPTPASEDRQHARARAASASRPRARSRCPTWTSRRRSRT